VGKVILNVNLDVDLHAEMKARAARERMTIQDWITAMIRRQIRARKGPDSALSA
jgi:predicted HicB family RNase H-like nuclease